LLATLISTGAAYGQAHLLAAGIALASIATVHVNPLLSGLSSLEGKPVFIDARKQGGKPTDKWAVIGDFVLAQGLKAQGLAVINGSQAVPNARIHEVLDPKHVYKDIWNRYAHIVLNSANEAREPVYTQLGGDIYLIRVDVCGRYLKRLGVTHVAYTGAAPARDKQCLIQLKAPKDAGVELYRFR
jgi:hypothetical protein